MPVNISFLCLLLIELQMACPVAYNTGTRLLRSAGQLTVDRTCYVVGGLYGNVQSLEYIKDVYSEGGQLIFNGDFNWFNTSLNSFTRVNEFVQSHSAIVGNVEYELTVPPSGDPPRGNVDHNKGSLLRTNSNGNYNEGEDDGPRGCGCSYPEYVSPIVNSRSEAIMGKLYSTGRRFPDVISWLKSLPKVLQISIGSIKVGVVHGDVTNLAGWGLSSEVLEPLDRDLMQRMNVVPGLNATVTTSMDLSKQCYDANVHAIVSTHSCLPVAVSFPLAHPVNIMSGQSVEKGFVFNNGSAGMPNFSNTTYGIITRISTDLHKPEGSLYGAVMGDVRFDAMPVPYDHKAFIKDFLHHWDPQSPAYLSYHGRIINGPNNYTVTNAARGRDIMRYSDL
jgi:hypothetical protein